MSIRRRSSSSVWKTSAACVHFQKQEYLYMMDCVVRELGKAEASVPNRNRQPKLTLKHTSSHNTSPVSLRIPFRSEYKAALTSES